MTADRLAPVLIALTGIAALAAALLLQFGFGLRPCILCKIERAPYVVAVLASAVVLARARGGRALTGFCAVVFAVGAAVAFYHVGVEGHWWGSMVCGSVSDAPMTLADLRRALSRPVEVPCDQVQWSLLGMSLTGYNMLLSLLLSAACAVAAAREKMWRSP